MCQISNRNSIKTKVIEQINDLFYIKKAKQLISNHVLYIKTNKDSAEKYTAIKIEYIGIKKYKMFISNKNHLKMFISDKKHLKM